MNFTFDFDIESSIGIISLSGDILSKDKDEELIEQVKQRMDKGQLKFILNIGSVEYINSSGLNLMLKVFTYIRNRGGELVITQPNKMVADLLKISKLDTIFNITADNQTAIKQFNELSK